jgi:hypothetical protein
MLFVTRSLTTLEAALAASDFFAPFKKTTKTR